MSKHKQIPTAATLAALAELDGIDSVAQLCRSRHHREAVPLMLRFAGRGADRCVLADAYGPAVPCREPVRL